MSLENINPTQVGNPHLYQGSLRGRKRRPSHPGNSSGSEPGAAGVVGSLPTLAEPELEKIADVDNLLHVFRDLKENGGQAAGIDGLRYGDFGRSEIADVLRIVTKEIRAGRYRPLPSRSVWIPKKPPSRDRRQLQLRTVIDRVVAKALAMQLTPYVEQELRPTYYGTGNRGSVWQLFADLEHAIRRDARTFLVCADIENAFGNVNLTRVMDELKRIIREPRLQQLIHVVFEGANPGKEDGTEQGNAISMLGLNVLLHYKLDLPLSADPTNPLLYRWVDDLNLLCSSAMEGERNLQQVSHLLQGIGFRLKESTKVVDLAKDKIKTLGFEISLKGDKQQLRFRLGKVPWQKLENKLKRTWNSPDPTKTAKQVIGGWVMFCGPAFQTFRRAPQRIMELASKCGLPEAVSSEEASSMCNEAARQWERFPTTRSPKTKEPTTRQADGYYDSGA